MCPNCIAPLEDKEHNSGTGPASSALSPLQAATALDEKLGMMAVWCRRGSIIGVMKTKAEGSICFSVPLSPWGYTNSPS